MFTDVLFSLTDLGKGVPGTAHAGATKVLGEVKTTAITFQKVQIDNAAASCQREHLPSELQSAAAPASVRSRQHNRPSGRIRLDRSAPLPVKTGARAVEAQELDSADFFVFTDLVRSRKSNVQSARRKLFQSLRRGPGFRKDVGPS